MRRCRQVECYSGIYAYCRCSRAKCSFIHLVIVPHARNLHALVIIGVVRCSLILVPFVKNGDHFTALAGSSTRQHSQASAILSCDLASGIDVNVSLRLYKALKSCFRLNESFLNSLLEFDVSLLRDLGKFFLALVSRC